MHTPQASMNSRHDFLSRVLAAHENPSVSLVLIQGEVGIGKSFMLDRIAATLKADRAWGIRGLKEVPFGAFAHLLPEARTRIELLRSFLAQVGQVLCIDDLDECDALSLSLVQRLIAEPGRTVIATVGANPASLSALLSRPTTKLFALPPLTRHEINAFARDKLGGDATVLALDELWQRSGGNPLVAEQMIRQAREAGVLTEASGRWSLHGRLAVPHPMRQSLLDQLDALPTSAREAAEFLAGLGRVSIDRFEAAAHPESSDRIRGLRHLIDAGIVEVTHRGDGLGHAAGFARPLLAEAVWQRLSAPRQRIILTEHLGSERAAPRPNAMRIAMLSLALDVRATATELMPAVRLAAGGLNADVVLKFTTAAIAQATGDDLEEAVRAEAGALIQLRRNGEAFAVIRAALSRIRPGRVAVRLALLLHETMVWAGGDQPGAVAMLRAQRRRYPRFIRIARAAFAVAEADGLVFAGRQADALALLDRDARPWRRMDPELAIARASVRAHALAQAGQVAQALEEISTAVTPDSQHQAAPILRSMICTVSGDPRLGTQLAADAWQTASDAEFAQAEAWAAIAMAVALLHAGELAPADEWAHRAAGAAEIAHLHDLHRLALLYRSVALSQQGVSDTHLLGQIDTVPDGVGFFKHQVPLASAWHAVVTDNRHESERIMAAAVDEAQRDGAGLSEALLLHEWLRMGNTSVWARLAELPQGYPLMSARLALARGVDSRDAGLLLDAAVEFESCGMMLFAAEAVASASRAVDASQKAVLEARARNLARRAGHPRTPMLAGLLDVVQLTRREREVSALARTLTNAQIAEQLHLSIRTVENHLARAFRKLDITSRAALPPDLTP